MILYPKLGKTRTNMGYKNLKIKIHMLSITSATSAASIKTLVNSFKVLLYYHDLLSKSQFPHLRQCYEGLNELTYVKCREE